MRTGDVLADRFVVEDHVSSGGIGMVFKGWDLDREEPVAIKSLAGVSESDVKRFSREAKILAALDIPGLVRHVFHGEHEGVPFLVMEWLERETVAARLARTGFDLGEAVALVRAACGPIAELHARGLVHRDIKPGNLMVGEAASDLVVIDLGLARRQVSTEATRVTQTGYILGTPNYMAPEQVRGEPVDPRTDVFALGCLLYECASGVPAFTGESWLAVHTKILVAQPPPLGAVCPAAPRALGAIVEQCLDKDARARPADAAALGAALASLPAMPASSRRPAGQLRTGTAPTAVAFGGQTVEAQRVGLLLLAGHLPADLVDALPREANVRLALLESECLVGIVECADRTELARTLARLAAELGRRVPEALVVASMQAIAWEDCIDVVADRVGRLARRSVFEPSTNRVLVDLELARLVGDSYELGATEDEFVELRGVRS